MESRLKKKLKLITLLTFALQSQQVFNIDKENG